MTEIEICPDCYARSCEQTTEEWFCEPCVSINDSV